MARQSPRTPQFEAAMVAIEWFSLLLFAGLWIALAYAWVGALGATAPSLWAYVPFILVIPLGFMIADLVTGFGHYFADNFCSEDTFLIGHALVFRFRQHHEDQKHICTLGFRELNGGLAGLSVPWLALGLWLAYQPGLWAAFAAGLCLTSALFMAATNQIHRWAHEKAPRPVRWLQRHDLILSPKRHAKHHKAPHDIHFCISCGWCNHLLDRIHFWHYLSDFLVLIGMPQSDDSVMGHARQRALGVAESAQTK